MLALRRVGVEGVGDVVRQAELEEGARLALRLPLLLEQGDDLLAREVDGHHRVGEGVDRRGLGVGHLAGLLVRGGLVEELVAQAAGVHDPDVGAAAAGLVQRIEPDLGREVAQGRLAQPVIPLAVVVRGGDVVADLAHDLAADLVGLRDGVVDDPRGVGVGRVVGAVVGRLGHVDVGGRVLGDLARLLVDAELQLAERLAVGVGLDDRPRAVAARDRGVPRVALVGVTGEDRIHLGAGVGDDLGEGPARVDLVLERAQVVALGRPLVVLRDDDIGLAVGRVSVAELAGDAVHRGDRVAELDVRDALWGDERGRRLGDDADDGDVEAVHLDDLVLVEGRVGRARVVDVRAEVREVGGLLDPTAEVVEAAVELVVPDRARLEAERVEELDRRQVLLRGGGEGGGPDVVPGGEEGRAVLTEVGLGAHHGAGEGLARVAGAVGVDPPVEVVDVEQVDARQGRVDATRVDGVRGTRAAGRGDEGDGGARADDQRCALPCDGHGSSRELV